MPIYIRYGDKNGVLYGNRDWGVMRIDMNNVGLLWRGGRYDDQ